MKSKLISLFIFSIYVFYANSKQFVVVSESNSPLMLEGLSGDKRVATWGRILEKSGYDALEPGMYYHFVTNDIEPVTSFKVFPNYRALQVPINESERGFTINEDGSLTFNNQKHTITNKSKDAKWIWLFGPKNEYIGSWTTAIKPGEGRGFNVKKGDVVDKIIITNDTVVSDVKYDPASTYGFKINSNNKIEPIKSTVNTQKIGEKDLSILTLNCYAFNETQSIAVERISGIPEVLAEMAAPTKEAKELVKEKVKTRIKLLGDLDKNVRKRLDEIGIFVNLQHPDIAIFQEVWGQTNKETLKYALNTLGSGNFDVKYYTNIKNPLLDDGLLIASKRPIDFFKAVTYNDSAGDEKFVAKGALIIGFKDYDNKPVLLVNTHLQSQTDWEMVTIRYNQMHQLGQEIKNVIAQNPAYANARLIIAGDLNEPIYFQDNVEYEVNGKKENLPGRTLFDRAAYLYQTLNTMGLNVTNAQTIKLLKDKYNANRSLSILEYNTADSSKGILRDNGSSKELLVKKGVDNNSLIKQFRDWDTDKESRLYFKDATDPSGTQLLDHYFVDNQSVLKNYKTYRKETLGDSSGTQIGKFTMTEFPKRFFSRQNAISDHAAVMATFGASEKAQKAIQ